MKAQTFLHDTRIVVNKYTIQKKQYDGIEHIVVPVVMMTQGVRSGSDGPIFHSSEELSHIVAAWNGIPVVINHPQNNEGMYISANEPSVQNVGKIFNAKFEDGKLKAEAWINPIKLKSLSTEALSYLNNQKPLEVSVGVFTDTEYVDGEFNGETYSGIARNYRPDHLALLPGGVGACSWEDGCGIRTNQKQNNMERNGGKGSGNFGYTGIPGHQGGSGDGGGGKNKTASTEMSKRFQEAGMSQEDADDIAFGLKKLKEKGQIDDEDAAYIEKLVKKGKYKLAQKMVNDTYKKSLSNNSENMDKHDYSPIVINSLNDRKNEYLEIVEKARNKVYALDNSMAYHYLAEVYDDGLIFSTRNKESGKETFYKQSFVIDTETSEMEFINEPIKVKREISFTTNGEKPKTIETNKKQKGENKMSKAKCAMVSGLITNERTNFTEDNREWLMGQDFDTLETLQPKMIANAKIKSEETPFTDEAVTSYIATKKQEDVIKLLPSELQANLNTMIKERAERREKMVKEILSINKQFTEIELNAMNCDILQKVHAMAKPAVEDAKPADYSAAAGSAHQMQTNSSNDEEPLMI